MSFSPPPWGQAVRLHCSQQLYSCRSEQQELVGMHLPGANRLRPVLKLL